MTQPSDASDTTATEAAPTSPAAPAGRFGWKAGLAVCGAIAAAGAGAVALIFATEPTAQRAGATKETAMLVDVVAAEAGDYRPTIVATGTVRPAREIVLRPRVEGQVIDHAPALSPGGVVAQGSALVRLDPADYRQTLQQRRNALEEAQAELRIERGRQEVAQKEFQLIDQSLSADNKALVLREPQLDAAQSRVASAQAALERARLQLARTTIEAPFDAQVIERQVDVGSQVAAGDALARLVGVERYWVEATVPVSKLRWLDFSEQRPDKGTPVRVHNRGAWGDGVHRQGHLYRLVGTLDEGTRMARVLITVADPMARDAAGDDAPRLLLGSYVEARMAGERLRDVVRLSRDYIRGDGTVWVMADGELVIRDVAIAVSDQEYAYIRSGLEAGERVVTSSLATIEEGAPLRVDDDTASPSSPGSDGADGASGRGRS